MFSVSQCEWKIHDLFVNSGHEKTDERLYLIHEIPLFADSSKAFDTKPSLVYFIMENGMKKAFDYELIIGHRV